jgi:hypothetical protein
MNLPSMNMRSLQASLRSVKSFVFALLAGVLLTGCATSTIETRRQERLAAYQGLSPELKALVDKGQIKVGMSQDAVYISWGPPSDVLQSETTEGALTTWQFHGAWMQETRFWTYREVTKDNTTFLERYLERDYNPRDYIKAEITFMNGVVKQWRTLPRPLN